MSRRSPTKSVIKTAGAGASAIVGAIGGTVVATTGAVAGAGAIDNGDDFSTVIVTAIVAVVVAVFAVIVVAVIVIAGIEALDNGDDGDVPHNGRLAEIRELPRRLIHLVAGLIRGPRNRRRPHMSAGVHPGTWVARLVTWLLDGGLRQLPEGQQGRYAEEWAEHRTHQQGWRLVWWALWLRGTATRTGREYRQARLPRNGG